MSVFEFLILVFRNESRDGRRIDGAGNSRMFVNFFHSTLNKRRKPCVFCHLS